MKQSDEHRYDDIISLPHHVSKNRPRMTALDRAAQFAPFKALVGLEDEISETARITEEREELSEEKEQEIDFILHILKEKILSEPCVKVTYFRPDHKKSGGVYLTVRGRLSAIDEGKRVLLFSDGRSVPIEDISFLSEDV